MNFFKQQELTKKKTRYLLLWYLIAVLVTGFLTSCIVRFGILQETESDKLLNAQRFFVDPSFGLIAAGVAIFILLVSLYKIMSLGKGGEYVAKLAGATPIDTKNGDLLLRRYMNVVEEISIASGTPVPKIYIMQNESNINAFAAGYEINDAVIAVSRGALEKLNRDELQGVVAHEFSHIFNGDMKLNIKLIGYLFGLSMIAQMGMRIFRTPGRSSSSRKKGGGGGVIALGLLLVGAIGMLFASLIKASISRQREFLADASAVQFTRNPLGISGALKKLLASDRAGMMTASKASEVSHMFFSQAVSSFLGLFATHPPLESRIQAIEPNFNLKKFIQAEKGDFIKKMQEEPLLHNQGPSTGVTSGFAAPSNVQIDSEVASAAGVEIAAAADLLQLLPETVRQQCYDLNGARLLVLGLFLNKDNKIDGQDKILKESLSQDEATKVIELHQLILPSIKTLRIPIIELSVQTLKKLDNLKQKEFLQICRLLIEADGKVTSSEFILLCLIEEFMHERTKFFEKKLPRSKLKNDCKIMLSFLAYLGHKDKKAASQAFERGYVEVYSDTAVIAEMNNQFLAALKLSLHRLHLAQTSFKKSILKACQKVVLYDDILTSEEYELLRLVAKILLLPLPLKADLIAK